jgi:hypothetical protein
LLVTVGEKMSKTVVASLIVGAAILAGVAAFIYFSPYQSCVRAYKQMIMVESAQAELYAAEKCAPLR